MGARLSVKVCASNLCAVRCRAVRCELESSLHTAQISALVVFEQAKGCADALAAAAAGATVDYNVPEPEGPYGLKAWLLEHQAQFPGNEVLGAQLDEWVRCYHLPTKYIVLD